MASQQHFESRRPEPTPEPEAPPAPPSTNPQAAARDASLDSLLDEIDGVLERNATDFVHGFVQKGGQ